VPVFVAPVGTIDDSVVDPGGIDPFWFVVMGRGGDNPTAIIPPTAAHKSFLLNQGARTRRRIGFVRSVQQTIAVIVVLEPYRSVPTGDDFRLLWLRTRSCAVCRTAFWRLLWWWFRSIVVIVIVGLSEVSFLIYGTNFQKSSSIAFVVFIAVFVIAAIDVVVVVVHGRHPVGIKVVDDAVVILSVVVEFLVYGLDFLLELVVVIDLRPGKGQESNGECRANNGRRQSPHAKLAPPTQ